MHGHKNGFKPGWASNQYRNKMGVWPNSFKRAPMCEPNQMVKNHIQSQNIAYANRRS